MNNRREGSGKVFPPYVNWELTNRCNMGCPYCFLGKNPEGVIPDLETEKIKRSIERLERNGAEMFNYAGGEPLMREDIPELIEHGKKQGLTTILSTNGIKLNKELIEELEGHLDWVSLPIDGYSSDTHNSIRKRQGHFKETTEKMKMVEESSVNLKINTMICKKNKEYIERIADLLENYEVKKWKMFQFSARGKAKKIKKEYQVSDEDFLSSRPKVKRNHSFDVIYSTNELRDNAYFLIGADGKVTVPTGEDYVEIGNLLEDDLETFRNQETLKLNKNIHNAKISYNLGDNHE